MDIKYNICPECGYQKNNMPNFCPSCGFNYRAYINKKEEEQAQITKEKETRKAEAKAKMIEEKGYFREGNEIYFGEYYYDNDKYMKPIEWDILEEKDGKALIISHYILDSRKFGRYKSKYRFSDIREWLNDEFYNASFNDFEKSLIQTTLVDNSIESAGNLDFSSHRYYIEPENCCCENTNDKIFLLSVKEAQNYYESEKKRQTIATNYATAQGLNYNQWWLRSTNFTGCSLNAYYVWTDGSLGGISFVETSGYGVRPACWIKL